VNDRIWVNYTKIKKVSIVSGRDVIIVLYFTVNDSGIVHIVCFSDEREDLVPQQPNLVRAGLPIGGWKLEPITERQIKVTYIIEMDSRGNIPKFLFATGLKDQAKSLVEIKALVKELEEQSGHQE
jgi:hypothetical protein